MKVAVYNISGKKVKDLKLDEALFDGEVNKSVLADVILMYQANQRSGTASTKTRSEVAGGGKKPWKQKGTGRARAGTIRSPIWVKGGVAFGPHPRDYSYSVPKKVKKIALKSGLNDKLLENRFKVINEWKLPELKTKSVLKILTSLEIKEKVLIILDKAESEISRAARNIKNVRLTTPKDVNAHDILLSDILLLSEQSLSDVIERLS